jgi:uncharacterized protein (TIGR02285 family)
MHMLLLAFVLICSSSWLCAAEKQTVTWYQKDFPPYIILEGPMKGNGIDDQIMKYMIKRLPEYEHTFEEANYSRISSDFMNQKSGVTTPIFKTPEREKYMLYSGIASYLVLPNGLIINRSDKERFLPFIFNDGTLDIEALCRSGRFVIGIASGRSYAGILDEMIRKYKDTAVFYERDGAYYLNILTMLQAKRMDAVFGFPVEIKYFGFEEKLEVLRVSKMVPYIPVYFGVPKNEWGQRLLDGLNAILKSKGTLTEFAGYYEYWLDEKSKIYYRQLIKKYYDGNPGATEQR